jgi:hypothetical protein
MRVNKSSSDGCIQSLWIKKREVLFVDKYQNFYGDETMCIQNCIFVKIRERSGLRHLQELIQMIVIPEVSS